MEFTFQVTVGLLAFCTFALNCTVPPVATWVAGAETETVAAGGAGDGDGGPPPPVAAQEIRPSGASNIPRKEMARLQPAGGRRGPRDVEKMVSKCMGENSPRQIRRK